MPYIPGNGDGGGGLPNKPTTPLRPATPNKSDNVVYNLLGVTTTVFGFWSDNPQNAVICDQIEPGSIAERYGIKPGDQIRSIVLHQDSGDVELTDPTAIVNALKIDAESWLDTIHIVRCSEQEIPLQKPKSAPTSEQYTQKRWDSKSPPNGAGKLPKSKNPNLATLGRWDTPPDAGSNYHEPPPSTALSNCTATTVNQSLGIAVQTHTHESVYVEGEVENFTLSFHSSIEAGTILQVKRGSLAEKLGLQAGDCLKKVSILTPLDSQPNGRFEASTISQIGITMPEDANDPALQDKYAQNMVTAIRLACNGPKSVTLDLTFDRGGELWGVSTKVGGQSLAR